MKRLLSKIFLFSFLVILLNCSSQNTISESKSNIPKYSIAIIQVEYHSADEKKYASITRDFIEEEFSTYSEYIVIDRVSIDKILNELSLNNTGLTDNNINRIGKMLQADRILLTKLQKIDNVWVLTGRLIAVETGTVIKTSSGRVSEVSKLDGAAKGLSRRITGRL